MVEVFKTNVDNTEEADLIINRLQHLFPEATINFDLSDCDRILRIESGLIQKQNVIEIVGELGYSCDVLD